MGNHNRSYRPRWFDCILLSKMTKDILIVKGDNSKATIKGRQRVRAGYSTDDYFKVLSPRDYNDVALLFLDMELFWSSPIEKAFEKYLALKKEQLPRD